MGKSDAHVLDGSPIVTKFNGKKYVWRQLPRREHRRLRGSLWEIMAVLGDGSAGNEMIRASSGMQVMTMILELCEDYNPKMNADIELIEGYIERDKENGFSELIEGVYKPLYKEWLEPWIADEKEKPKGSAKKKQD